MPVFRAPDGVSFHFEIEGQGPPLLLHLGAGCDASLWRAAGYVDALSTTSDTRGWRYLLDDMTAAEKFPVPQWMLDRVTATDIEPFFAWTKARPSWNWSPWDALPLVDSPTLMIVGELEDPDDVMGEAASFMRDASRIRIPDREHLNAFVDSAMVLPHVTEFLARHAGR